MIHLVLNNSQTQQTTHIQIAEPNVEQGQYREPVYRVMFELIGTSSHIVIQTNFTLKIHDLLSKL